ncbi:MAG TPA: circadian clock KaiB family protein [Nitrospiraceae bacterium]|nr:circadian clock KaiB family protein [Nitrospiraceae bacterium]
MVKRKTKTPREKTAAYEDALGKADAQVYVLKLCVSGMTPRSREALMNLKQICETYLEGHYQLEVIDLYQQPALAAKHQIIATPTLLKSYPPPLRRLIGDLSDTDAAIQRLGIPLLQKGDS